MTYRPPGPDKQRRDAERARRLEEQRREEGDDLLACAACGGGHLPDQACAPLGLDLAGAGAIAPANGLLPTLALTEEEREELALALDQRRELRVGDRIRAIGPALGSKLRPDGPARTRILASVGDGWRVEPYPGSCSKVGKDAYITKKAADTMWLLDLDLQVEA